MTTLAALLASAATMPWAIRPELMDALRATLTPPSVGASRVIGLDATLPEAAVHPATEKAIARKQGSVALINIRGTITTQPSIFDRLFGGGYANPAQIAGAVRAAVEDSTVKAVVMDYDSPGGSVFGVAEAAEQIRALRGKKPILAQVTGQCCSAAYHLASAADEIIASPSSMVGSIGVYMMHMDFSKQNEMIGLKVTYIHAGKFKVEGNMDEPLTKEAEAHLQEMANDYMALFVNAVAAGRGVPVSTVKGEAYGEGRTFIAERAVSRGLADKVRTLSDTLAAYGVAASTPQQQGRRTPVALARRLLDLQG